MLNKKSAGLACLIAGGLVWPAGLYLEYGVPQILPIHLAFIGCGIYLRGSHLLLKLREYQNKKSK